MLSVASIDPYCVNPFSRVFVDFSYRGITRIFWDFQPLFVDREPYSLQVQVAEADIPTSQWINVGLPVTNVCQTSITDDQLRLASGKEPNLFYRVQLTAAPGPGPENCPGNVYYSPNATIFGNLPLALWWKLQELNRKEFLRFAKLGVANRGYLLKQKRSGVPCPVCTDTLTGEITDSDCPDCWGTQFAGGFWPAIANFYMDTEPYPHHPMHDQQMRGQIDDSEVCTARALAEPYLSTYDIFIDATSDRRYRMHEVKFLSHIRMVPCVSQVTLKLIPFSDSIYKFPLPICPEAPPYWCQY